MCGTRVSIVLAAGLRVTQMPLSEVWSKEVQMIRNCSLRSFLAMPLPWVPKPVFSKRKEATPKPASHFTYFIKTVMWCFISVSEASIYLEISIRVGSGDRTKPWVLRNGTTIDQHQCLNDLFYSLVSDSRILISNDQSAHLLKSEWRCRDGGNVERPLWRWLCLPVVIKLLP